MVMYVSVSSLPDQVRDDVSLYGWNSLPKEETAEEIEQRLIKNRLRLSRQKEQRRLRDQAKKGKK